MGNVQSDLAERTPVGALRPSSREIIAGHLDKCGQIHNNRLNDYRGFLEILKCTCFEITAYASLPVGVSPTQKLIDDWPDISQANGTSAPTILDGWRILAQLGRKDILNQCCIRVEEDIEVFHSQRGPSQNLTDSASQSSNFEGDRDKEVIFVDDVRHGAGFIYDGFVVAAPSDLEMVTQICRRLQELGIRLIDPNWDMLPGLQFDVWTYAIDKRCRKLILVMGKEFSNSEICAFAVQYAEALSLDATKRKIIVVKIHENVAVHPSLTCYKTFPIDCELSQLVLAIKAPSYPELVGRSFSRPVHREIACVRPMSQTAILQTQSENREGENESFTGHQSQISNKNSLQSVPTESLNEDHITHKDGHFNNTACNSFDFKNREQFEPIMDGSSSSGSSYLFISNTLRTDRLGIHTDFEARSETENDLSEEDDELHQEPLTEAEESTISGIEKMTGWSAQMAQKREECMSSQSKRSIKGRFFQKFHRFFHGKKN